MADKTRPHQRIAFHDYETLNIDRSATQGAAKPIEYAAIITDTDLNHIKDERHHKIIKPPIDVIGDPNAFMVHGVDPEMTEKVGISEFEFAKWIGELYGRDGTVISGYNSIRFDSEVTRHTRFRNLLPAYTQEFENGNFQLDIMKVVLMAYSMSPNILNFPKKENGNDSLRLEDLTAANGISHQDAHSALSDVEATIAIAKLIKEKNPNLWHYALWLTNKRNIEPLMDENDMLFYTDTTIGQGSRYTSVIHPLVVDSKMGSKYICVDLNSEDLDIIFDETPEEINRLMFTKKEELGNDARAVPYQTVTVNKSPILIPASGRVIANQSESMGFDLERIQKNLGRIKNNEELKRNAQSAMVSEQRDPPKNAAHRLFFLPGFPSTPTNKLLGRQHAKDDNGVTILRNANIANLAKKTDFPDIFYPLALQAKFRTWPRELMRDPDVSPAEFVDFVDYLDEKLNHGIDGTYTFAEAEADRASISKRHVLTDGQKHILGNLDKQREGQKELLNAMKQRAEELRPAAEAEKKKSPDYKALRYKNQGPSGPGM